MTDRPGNSNAPLWPALADSIGAAEIGAANHHLAVSSRRFLAHEHLPKDYQSLFPRLFIPMSAWLLTLPRETKGPLLVGIAGAQGTGKTTAAKALQLTLHYAFGRSCCLLSLDDFYLTRAQRQSLASQVHPLFATRGVPGTHDVELIRQTLNRLKRAQADSETPLPLFDKSTDERRPREHWALYRGRPDIVLFEGWCVGARPASDQESLEHPLNAVESASDSQASWRHHVDRMLAGPYAELFAQLSRLIFFAAPDWDRVLEWRRLQEQKLHRATGVASPLLDEQRLQEFVATYERISRRMLSETPQYADVTVNLAPSHEVSSVQVTA